MHEAAIAEEIKAIVLEKMKENKAEKVLTVKVSAGELTSVVPEALDFAFKSVSEGTPMQGADVIIKTVKMKGRCKDCGGEFRIKDFIYVCPSCGSVNVELTQGKELVIETIQME